MTALDQDALFAACRTIYVLAQGKLVLPPLMRGLDSEQFHPGHEYLISTCAGSIRFAVSLNSEHADRNTATASQLPLTFHAELLSQDTCTELRGKDRHELVRAFLLGVKMPIALDAISEGVPQRLSVQLAPRYSYDCGEVLNPHADDVCKDICDRVSEALYAHSAEFFAEPQNGLAVWRMRAAQELFGDPRPAPEMFWPYTASDADTANPFVAPAAAARAPAPHYMRYAIAASLAAALIAPLAFMTGFAMQGSANVSVTAEEQPVRLTLPIAQQTQPAETISLAVLNAPDWSGAERNETRPAFELTHAPHVAPMPAMLAAPLINLLPLITPSAHAVEARPAVHSAPKVKAAAKAKKITKHVKRPAPNHFANPFPSAKTVVATIAGAMRGIEKFPVRVAALMKAQTSAR